MKKQDVVQTPLQGERTVTIRHIMSRKTKAIYKRSTPYIALWNHLSEYSNMQKPNKVGVELVLIDGKIKAIIDVE